MPMDKLDGIVIGEVTNQRLQPEQHVGLRGDYLRTAREREDRNRDQLRQMRQDHKESEAGIARLLELVGKVLMDAESGSMRERLVNLRFRRDELADQISDLTRRLAMAEPEITPEKIEKLALLLREKLHHGPPICGKPMLAYYSARCEWTTGKSASAAQKPRWPAVLYFAREWRTREDSNLWPLPSEGSALSS